MKKPTMSVSVVWLNADLAKLFHFSEDCMERETLKFNHVDPTLITGDGYQRDCEADYQKLSNQLQNSHRILILGSESTGKTFFAHLKDQYPFIANKVVGCETLENPNDQQIATYALKYFNKPVF